MDAVIVIGFLIAFYLHYWLGVMKGKHSALGLIHKKAKQNIARQGELLKMHTQSAADSFDELAHGTDDLMEVSTEILDNYWKPF